MFNDEIYIQNNGAAIGSSLGPLLANIFMAPLGEEVIPTLTPYFYVTGGDLLKTHRLKLILKNSYHPDVQFTFELEKNKQITFLDVLIKRTAANQRKHVVLEKAQALICILIGMHTHQLNGELEH